MAAPALDDWARRTATELDRRADRLREVARSTERQVKALVFDTPRGRRLDNVTRRRTRALVDIANELDEVKRHLRRMEGQPDSGTVFIPAGRWTNDLGDEVELYSAVGGGGGRYRLDPKGMRLTAKRLDTAAGELRQQARALDRLDEDMPPDAPARIRRELRRETQQAENRLRRIAKAMNQDANELRRRSMVRDLADGRGPAYHLGEVDVPSVAVSRAGAGEGSRMMEDVLAVLGPEEAVAAYLVAAEQLHDLAHRLCSRLPIIYDRPTWWPTSPYRPWPHPEVQLPDTAEPFADADNVRPTRPRFPIPPGMAFTKDLVSDPETGEMIGRPEYWQRYGHSPGRGPVTRPLTVACFTPSCTVVDPETNEAIDYRIYRDKVGPCGPAPARPVRPISVDDPIWDPPPPPAGGGEVGLPIQPLPIAPDVPDRGNTGGDDGAGGGGGGWKAGDGGDGGRPGDGGGTTVPSDGTGALVEPTAAEDTATSAEEQPLQAELAAVTKGGAKINPEAIGIAAGIALAGSAAAALVVHRKAAARKVRSWVDFRARRARTQGEQPARTEADREGDGLVTGTGSARRRNSEAAGPEQHGPQTTRRPTGG